MQISFGERELEFISALLARDDLHLILLVGGGIAVALYYIKRAYKD